MQDQLPCDSARKSARQIATIRPVKESTDLHVIGHLSLLHKTLSIRASIRNNQRTTWICANSIHFQLSFTSGIANGIRDYDLGSFRSALTLGVYLMLLRSKALNVSMNERLTERKHRGTALSNTIKVKSCMTKP